MNQKHSAIIIGSGFSGLCMAIKLKEQGIHDFIILEKANDIGGTWRENTYPGAECDVPSALYSYSFEPYPDWEYKWSHQPQILKYLKYCAVKYDILQHVRYSKELTAAEWNKGNWNISTKDGTNYTSQSFIVAIGQLHHPSTPTISGQELFQGPTWHSANWNHDISLEGKTVGVIGNAASATQFIPEIAQEAKQVVVFQRTPNWMLPKQDRLYMNWEKNLVRKIPFLLKLYRLKIWLLGGALYLLMKNGNQLLRSFYQWQTKKYIKDTIDDPILREKLVPDYPLGGKRVLFSDNYYAALNRENVDLVTSPIQEIQEDKILTKDGISKSLDILIYSTGFITNPFLSNLKIIGLEQQSIQDAWKDGPINHLGMTVSGFPNMFLMYGPNTNLGHNSIILMSEAQAGYISQCVTKLQSDVSVRALEIKKDVMEDYHIEIQKRLKKMIWNQIDNSWYKSKDGNQPNNWPGRTIEYMKRTKRVNFNEFNIS